MTKGDRPGCLRPLLGGALGGVSGALAGVAIGMADAPVIDPADPLEHEWYTPFALFVLPCLAAFLGAIIGAIAAVACEGVGGKAVAWGSGGLLLGFMAGKVVPVGDGDGSRLIWHLILTACGLGCGLHVAAMKSAGTARRTDEPGG